MANGRAIQRWIVQVQMAEWANLVLLRHQLLTIRAGLSVRHLCNVSWTQNHGVRKSNDKKHGSIEPPEEEGMTFLTGNESGKQSKKEKESNQVHSNSEHQNSKPWAGSFQFDELNSERFIAHEDKDSQKHLRRCILPK
jgi:hypothetical protein